MPEVFKQAEGRRIVEGFIEVIKENRQYLSDIDGAIGDGDHGINMAKGFSLAGDRLEDGMGFSDALKVLGSVLMMEIGGSMGPLYGKFFRSMSKECKEHDVISAADISRMLNAGYESIKALGAVPGDKTLVDTLDPAIAAFDGAVDSGKSFRAALEDMREAAKQGKDSTKEMVAKLGRASRLGERSRGALDPGATSCWLILDSMGKTIGELLS